MPKSPKGGGPIEQLGNFVSKIYIMISPHLINFHEFKSDVSFLKEFLFLQVLNQLCGISITNSLVLTWT